MGCFIHAPPLFALRMLARFASSLICCTLAHECRTRRQILKSFPLVMINSRSISRSSSKIAAATVGVHVEIRTQVECAVSQKTLKTVGKDEGSSLAFVAHTHRLFLTQTLDDATRLRAVTAANRAARTTVTEQERQAETEGERSERICRFQQNAAVCGACVRTVDD